MDKRARGKGSRRRSVWVGVAVVVALAAGAARLWSQGTAAAQMSRLERAQLLHPALQPEVMSRAEAARGVRARLEAMAQRYEKRQRARRQGPARDYHVPMAPPDPDGEPQAEPDPGSGRGDSRLGGVR